MDGCVIKHDLTGESYVRADTGVFSSYLYSTKVLVLRSILEEQLTPCSLRRPIPEPGCQLRIRAAVLSRMAVKLPPR
jgi:hypothetical protein